MAPADRISLDRPLPILFLVEESASMAEGEQHNLVAAALNSYLKDLVLRSVVRGRSVGDFFHVGAIGYGSDVRDLLLSQGSSVMIPVSELANNPKRMRSVLRAGQSFEDPVWIDLVPEGVTPLNRAFDLAGRRLVEWCNLHEDSLPPMVISIRNSVPTDGSHLALLDLAQRLMRIRTTHGELLLMNFHVAAGDPRGVVFPSTADEMQDPLGEQIFHTSSLLPPHMLESAKRFGYEVAPGARACSYRSPPPQILHLLEIGTNVPTADEGSRDEHGATLGSHSPIDPVAAESGLSVFLSHADRAPDGLSSRIAETLRAAGNTVWRAPESIAPGSDWINEAVQSLRRADVLLVLATEESLSSHWVKREIAWGLNLEAEQGLTIVPLRVENLSLPLELRTFQTIDVSDDSAVLSQLPSQLARIRRSD